jgi:ATP-dependent DNA ligase
VKLFRAVCTKDVEGVVAKRKAGVYQAGERWFKIRNRDYSQMAGRHPDKR